MPPENTENHNENGEKRPIIQALRTYKLDAAQTIKERKESLASMVLAEQTKRQAESESGDHTIRIRKFYVFTSLAFVIGSILLVWGIIYFVQVYQGGERARIAGIFLHDLILTETQKKIVIAQEDRNSIVPPLHAELASNTLAEGSIEGIFYLAEWPLPDNKKGVKQEAISSGSFITASKLAVPSILEQTFDAPFFIGIYRGKASYPFLMFKIVPGSYPNAFSAMISWEPTMYTDLMPLWSLPPITFAPGTIRFVDAIVMNKDVRILSSLYGENVLYYTFFDKETLIITTSPDALAEIISRLTTPRKVIH